MIQEQRIKLLNKSDVKKGSYVLYWMQASQRAEYNHALEYAVLRANELRLPLVVFFGLTPDFPDANERHYHFMLTGLKEVCSALQGRGIKMIVRAQSPEAGVTELSKDASLVVADRGYLRLQKQWRYFAALRCECSFFQVESDVVVPVEEASPREEYSAATFRRKINKILPHYLVKLKEQELNKSSLGLDIESIDIGDTQKILAMLNIDRSVPPVEFLKGGTSEAKKHLKDFLRNKIDEYPERRNNPSEDYISHMSPYLHFGQISPLYCALKAMETRSPGTDVYLEELIVRKELSINYVYYNPFYDSIDGIPEWAKKTLHEHRKDPRQYIYNLEELEQGKTHDSYWNAAQEQMVKHGEMHGYLRMYWGKKIIEWTVCPEYAFKTALYLNNKYELDGRDPNGFTGIAWCFGKHDRPWPRRKIFGLIRYMSKKGSRL